VKSEEGSSSSPPVVKMEVEDVGVGTEELESGVVDGLGVGIGVGVGEGAEGERVKQEEVEERRGGVEVREDEKMELDEVKEEQQTTPESKNDSPLPKDEDGKESIYSDKTPNTKSLQVCKFPFLLLTFELFIEDI
jgi:hypothetical protein